jgi:hypothetical protein
MLTFALYVPRRLPFGVLGKPATGAGSTLGRLLDASSTNSCAYPKSSAPCFENCHWAPTASQIRSASGSRGVRNASCTGVVSYAVPNRSFHSLFSW